MLASALILFREVLEAALIIGIVMAATKEVMGRGRWILYGIGGGLFGAAAIAFFAQTISEAAAGMGQEYFNAGVLFLAVVMLGWHNVWMSRHGREISQKMNAVGSAVRLGARPLYALAIVVGLATLREGSEVVLFLYGIALGGGAAAEMMMGSLLGLAAGGVLGAVLYFGLLRIPMKHLFTVTSWMILLLAAGLASQGAHYLVQADVLPPLGQAIWDSSHLLSERSMTGQLLHVLVGYSARPDGIQLVFYVATLLVIGGLMRLYGTTANLKANGGAKPVLALLAAAGMVWSLVLGGAMAAEPQCWVSYEEFEEHVPHFDLRRCPEDNIENGFCRLVVDGDKVHLYYFSFEGDICLYDQRSYGLAKFLKRFGPTYLID
ncbi:MAG: iron permease [Rhodospirillaceae bacterium]|nr:MAG: iron permease [Rhodospirillaceae bacterium]